MISAIRVGSFVLIYFFSCRENLIEEVQFFLKNYYGVSVSFDRRSASSDHPGPMSFIEYLKYMAKPGSQGDVLMLTAFSLLTGANLSVLDGSPTGGFAESAIRHPFMLGELLEEDMVVPETQPDGELVVVPQTKQVSAVALVLVWNGAGFLSASK